jgi:hypothetical protein
MPTQAAVVRCFLFLVVNAPFKVCLEASILDYGQPVSKHGLPWDRRDRL